MADKKPIGVGVGVMILREGKVLLGKRHEDPVKASSLLNGAGKWSMPGGKIKFGESIYDAAIRETLEETGLNLNNPRMICVNSDILNDVHFVTMGILCDDFYGEPELREPDRFVEWKWFDLSKLPSPMYFPSEKVLKCYLKKVSSLDE